MAGIDYWLGRKYAILQQQADASTTSAVAGANQANSSANLNNVNARLAPTTAASENALRAANTNLIGLQAQTVLPESRARIAQIGAETGFTRTQDRALGQEIMRDIVLPDALRRTMGTAYTPPTIGQQVRLSAAAPAAQRMPQDRPAWWENDAMWLDRINGFGR